jgi:hypothetical protein
MVISSIDRNNAMLDLSETTSPKIISINESDSVKNYVRVKNYYLPISDFDYDVNSRYMATITKDKLFKATSVLDIVPQNAEWQNIPFETVAVAVLQNDNEIREIGTDKELNVAQINLLKSTDYSTDFYIRGRGKNNHPKTGKIEDYVYYLTIVPEKEAEYTIGNDAFIAYLKENSKEQIKYVEESLLRPGKIQFTITKEGTIENVELISTSGYFNIDSMMIELISNSPGKWKPAENSVGEKVNQKLVFSFGMMGC